MTAAIAVPSSGVQRAGQQRAGVEPLAEHAERDDDHQRQRALAQRVDDVDADRGLVQAPRLRAHRRSGPARRSGCAGPRRRASSSSGIVWLPAAVWISTLARPSCCSSRPLVVSTCCTRGIGISVRRTVSGPVADVDRLRGDVPAPAPPPQRGHDRGPDHEAHERHHAHEQRERSVQRAGGEHAGDEQRAPQQHLVQAPDPRRVVREPPRRLGAHSLRARSRASRSYSRRPSSPSNRYGRVTTCAEAARRSRRRWLRCARARS